MRIKTTEKQVVISNLKTEIKCESNRSSFKVE